MSLILDQNLSPHLPKRLADIFPGVTHVRHRGLGSANDSEIWAYAAREQLAIVSKDSDFHQRSLLFGAPPKVVWIRRGNCSTDDVERILRSRHPAIVDFLRDSVESFLVIG